MISDLPTHSVSKQKEQLFRIPNIQQSPVFFLRKVEAKSLELFWQDFIE